METKQQKVQMMKVTLLTTLCGPEGNAAPGAVLELTKDKATKMIESRFARPYDHERDRKAKRGLTKYVLSQ